MSGHQRPHPCASCSTANAASASSTRGRQGRAGARPRDLPVGRRRRQSADSWNLRHRPARTPEEAWIEVKHELNSVGEISATTSNARIIWKVKDPASPTNCAAWAPSPDDEVPRYGRRFHEPAVGAIVPSSRHGRSWPTPDVQMHLVPYSFKDPKTRKLQDFPSMTTPAYQLRPKKPGLIHVRSADAKAQPAIRFNFLADSIDQQAMGARLPLDEADRRCRTV